jgi:hypothetical protein
MFSGAVYNVVLQTKRLPPHIRKSAKGIIPVIQAAGYSTGALFTYLKRAESLPFRIRLSRSQQATLSPLVFSAGSETRRVSQSLSSDASFCLLCMVCTHHNGQSSALLASVNTGVSHVLLVSVSALYGNTKNGFRV